MLITSHRCTTPVWQTPGSATPLAIATTRPLEWMLLPGNRRVMTKSKATGVGPEARETAWESPLFAIIAWFSVAMRNCQAQIFILDAFVSICLSICLSVSVCLSVCLSVCWLNWQKPPRVIDAFFLPFRTIKTYENHAFIVQEVPQIHAQPLLPGVADVATASSLISACVFRCASLA